MNLVLDKISEIIKKNNETINEKIIGINYLEQLKYLIVNDLTLLDEKIFKDILANNEENKTEDYSFDFNNRPITLSINFFKESISKINNTINKDNLSIVGYGLKNITINDNNNAKKSITLKLFKNMGIVLSQGTLVSEKIASGSIILDINSNKNELNLEKE